MAKESRARRPICVIYELTHQNAAYHQGFRYRVHDIDDDEWHIHTKERLFELLAIHGLHPVTQEQMTKARAARRRHRKKEHSTSPVPKKSRAKAELNEKPAPVLRSIAEEVWGAMEALIGAKLEAQSSKSASAIQVADVKAALVDLIRKSLGDSGS